MKWREISRLATYGYETKMLKYYEQLKPKMRRNAYFLYDYALKSNYVGMYDKSLELTRECICYLNDYDVQLLLADDLANTNQMQEAIIAYQYAAKMIPSRFEPLYAIMNIYETMNDTVDAVNIAREIQRKAIKIPSCDVDLMKNEANSIIEKYTVSLQNTPSVFEDD